jgi:hypothetical protein
MQAGRWDRLAPLTGIVFVLLVVIAVIIQGDTPDTHATAQEVQSFYSKHHDKMEGSAGLIAVSIPFLVFFVSTLFRALRAAGGGGRLAAAAFGGGILLAAGIAVGSTIQIAAAEAGKKAATLGVTQTLHVLNDNSYIPIGAGMGVLVLASGLAAVRYGALPRWLGWAGIVLGVLSFTPVGFFAFLASALWLVVTAVILYLQGAPASAGPAYSSTQA